MSGPPFFMVLRIRYIATLAQAAQPGMEPAEQPDIAESNHHSLRDWSGIISLCMSDAAGLQNEIADKSADSIVWNPVQRKGITDKRLATQGDGKIFDQSGILPNEQFTSREHQEEYYQQWSLPQCGHDKLNHQRPNDHKKNSGQIVAHLIAVRSVVELER